MDVVILVLKRDDANDIHVKVRRRKIIKSAFNLDFYVPSELYIFFYSLEQNLKNMFNFTDKLTFL